MDVVQALKQALDELEDVRKSKALLKELLELWPRYGHERSHYKAVADFMGLYHQKYMLKLLDKVEKHLA